ncbi:MAG: hypothetical protein KA954_03695 [Chitinophagales bacterium]|nr:hypothetical protein [Bacteroidota bacterium]MBP7398665.1 hypothetical protein [Chitinophagales bacterium]MBP8753546.1 hypothetical protein [Chitinophagales bacterium]MBP9190397.1 hypothetical protein [Chitinophagales bacterium]MBP9548294.1 hypothetical protein [Chitinophagales bacterium]
MKKVLLLAVFAGFLSMGISAQTADKKVSETSYMLAKRGQEDAFQKAVMAHNAKFHPANTGNSALLRKVVYGEKAGWFVWIHGPVTYADLDIVKGQAHDDDWSNTVDPLIEEYGPIDLWEYDDALSYGKEKMATAKYYDAWVIDIKRGEGYRFDEMMKKLSAAVKEDGKHSNLVWWNVVRRDSKADVSILWTFDNFAEWDSDTLKDAYEKVNGEGSWRLFWEEWEEVVVDYTEEIREMIR